MGSCLTYIKTAKSHMCEWLCKKKVILNHSQCINHAVYSKKKNAALMKNTFFFRLTWKKSFLMWFK